MKTKNKISCHLSRRDYKCKKYIHPPERRKAAGGRVFAGVSLTVDEFYQIEKFMYDYKVAPNSMSRFMKAATIEKINRLRKIIKKPYKGERS